MGAEFTIEGTAFDTLGYDATHSQVLDLALEDATGLDAPRVVYSVVATSDGAPALTFSPSTGIPTTPTGTVTVTMPGSGVHSYNIQCQVNEGRDSTGRTNREYTKQRIVAIKSTNLELRKLVPGETTQYSSTGWTQEQNSAVDAIEAGAGGGGTTEDVEATADTLALRGPDAELKAAWIEAPIVRTTAGGDVAFQEGSTTYGRLRSTDAPAQVGDLRFRSNGRLQICASPADGYPVDVHEVPLLDDVRLRGGENKPLDASASSTFWAVLLQTQGKACELQIAFITPLQAIVGDSSNYASIQIRAITGAVDPSVLLASITTQDAIDELSPVSMTIHNATIEAGQYVYVVINKVGSGVTLPPMYIGVVAAPVLTYSPA